MNWAWSQRTSATNTAVLSRLAFHADPSHRCWPGAKSISQATNLALKSVRRALTSLEREGLIQIERQLHPSGRCLPSVYKLAVTQEVPGGSEAGCGADALRQGWGTQSPHQVVRETRGEGDRESPGGGQRVPDVGGHCDHRILKKNPIPRIEAKTELDGPLEKGQGNGPEAHPAGGKRATGNADFDAFWAAYPKKTGKLAAQREFAAARKHASAAEIMAGLARYKPDLRFTLDPERWLKRGRWMDEAPPPSSAGAPESQPRRRRPTDPNPANPVSRETGQHFSDAEMLDMAAEGGW